MEWHCSCRPRQVRKPLEIRPLAAVCSFGGESGLPERDRELRSRLYHLLDKSCQRFRGLDVFLIATLVQLEFLLFQRRQACTEQR